MVDYSNLIAQATAQAQIEDQTAAKPSFEYKVAPEGYTVARLVSYIEVGAQPQRAYQGQEKPDAPKVRLAFECLGANHVTEYEHDGETKTRTNIIRVDMPLYFSEKSNYSKLLKALRGGDTEIIHMAQMLNQPCLLKITHNKSKDGKKTYANIKSDGVWNVGPAVTTDPITNATTTLQVPPATQDIQMLLWNAPSQEQWASIFIDGSYTREIDGVEQTFSKNFLQEECLSASNFTGSALEGMLGGSDEIIKAMGTPKPEPKSEPKPESSDELLDAIGL